MRKWNNEKVIVEKVELSCLLYRSNVSKVVLTVSSPKSYLDIPSRCSWATDRGLNYLVRKDRFGLA